MKIYFVTKNRFKITEVLDYFKHSDIKSRANIDLFIVEQEVQEILHPNIEVIVRQKAVEAYQYLGLPCVVEHGGIFMDDLPGLPGGVGQIVWDAVGDRMCSFLRREDSRGATARSVIGYCDGKRVHIYQGETRGEVAECSRGDYTFHWDPIFIPEGSDQTYGEMGMEKKRSTSPVVKAWDTFLKAKFLNHQDLFRR
ncbi:MAG TPA: non-canonical purine NTP pyrophosphatase [Blastocatellia bacterium]|nr:non-canonical purine NTP pyrophosphatase [Blastocatellia bacterium]